MARSKKDKRAAKKRRQSVSRADRVQATPETLAKLRPCPLKAMVHDGTMTPAEYEAALEIWDANDLLVKELKASASSTERRDRAHVQPGGRGERLLSIYREWSKTLPQRFYLMADTVVGWIEDHDPAQRMTNDMQRRMLVKACETWIDVARDHDRARRAEANSNGVAQQTVAVGEYITAAQFKQGLERTKQAAIDGAVMAMVLNRRRRRNPFPT